MKKIIQLAMVTLLMTACSSVTVRTDGLKETHEPPTFEKRYSYWWWGLRGEYDINVRQVCKGHGIDQIQAVDTISDSLLQLITAGIYSPRTAKIWCKES